MEHRVKHHGHVVMSFVIEDEEIVSVSEHYNEIYHKDKNVKNSLVQVVAEVAMAIGGREGAIAAEEVLRLAPNSEVPLISVKKYITDNREDHKEFIERQVQRLTEEIADLRSSLEEREVDWGV